MCNETLVKTLFVSDLDGTLLNQKQSLSDTTRNLINGLIDNGVAFTFATARSLTSAREVTKGLALRLPVIVYNGAFVQDFVSGATVIARQFSKAQKEDILVRHHAHDLHPRVYALHEGVERFSYEAEKASWGTRAYLDKRQADKRACPTTKENLISGNVFCFSVIDEHKKLLPLYNELKESYHTVLYQDPYTGDWWLEVLPQYATKAEAVMAVKEKYGFERVVVFGDEKNDLSMFSVADESFAVANANEAVKRAASGMILSNESDGVALYLKSCYEKYKNMN